MRHSSHVHQVGSRICGTCFGLYWALFMPGGCWVQNAQNQVILSFCFEKKRPPPKLYHRLHPQVMTHRTGFLGPIKLFRETGASIERAPAMATAVHSNGTRGRESHSLHGTRDSMAPAPGRVTVIPLLAGESKAQTLNKPLYISLHLLYILFLSFLLSLQFSSYLLGSASLNDLNVRLAYHINRSVGHSWFSR